MYEELTKLSALHQNKIDEMYKYLEISLKKYELKKLEEEASTVEFWSNQKKAQDNINATSKIKKILDPYEKIVGDLEDLTILLELLRTEEKGAIEEAILVEKKISEDISQLEIQLLLGNEFDENNAYLTLHAGAGGTESCLSLIHI